MPCTGGFRTSCTLVLAEIEVAGCELTEYALEYPELDQTQDGIQQFVFQNNIMGVNGITAKNVV